MLTSSRALFRRIRWSEHRIRWSSYGYTIITRSSHLASFSFFALGGIFQHLISLLYHLQIVLTSLQSSKRALIFHYSSIIFTFGRNFLKKVHKNKRTRAYSALVLIIRRRKTIVFTEASPPNNCFSTPHIVNTVVNTTSSLAALVLRCC